MIDQRQISLLEDFAKLLNKHGVDAFESLANSLSSPTTTQELVEMLRIGAHAGRVARVKKRGPRPMQDRLSVRGLLDRIRNVEPEKFELLEELHSALQRRAVLPTLRDFRDFASDFGLEPITADARQKAVNPFMRSLTNMPLSDLRKMSHALQKYSNTDPGLAGWSAIILGKEPD